MFSSWVVPWFKVLRCLASYPPLGQPSCVAPPASQPAIAAVLSHIHGPTPLSSTSSLNVLASAHMACGSKSKSEKIPPWWAWLPPVCA